MEAETRIITRYSETDQMEIVHHSNYTVWFEAGCRWVKQCMRACNVIIDIDDAEEEEK